MRCAEPAGRDLPLRLRLVEVVGEREPARSEWYVEDEPVSSGPPSRASPSGVTDHAISPRSVA